MPKIHLTINGRAVEAESGDTLLTAARQAGIRIPTLCYHPALPPEESCRLCVVELIRGRWSSLVAACVYPAREGMVIETDTDPVIKARKVILELILSDHPLDCMTCNAAGSCELMDLAYEYGIRESSLPGQTHSYPVDPDPNPYIHWDMNKCILCRRCIRACSEMQCAHVLTKADRGFNQRISTAFGNILGQSGCELDGQCVALCPVDALSEKLPRGRGRNWEMSRTQSVCPLCGCGCVFDLNTKDRELIKITSNFSSPANQGALCRRGRFEYAYLNQPQRLKKPVLKQGGTWTEVDWETALQFLADKTKVLMTQHGPESLGLMLSPVLTNEELYLWQKFARTVWGTPHIDHAGSGVWAPVQEILKSRLGLPGMTNPTNDLLNSSGIILLGSQLMETHPIVGIKVRQAVQQGSRLLVIDEVPRTFRHQAELLLAPTPGTEAVLLQGLLNALIQGRHYDASFVDRQTTGIAGLQATLAEFTPDMVASQTGISPEMFQEALAFLSKHRPLALICPPPLGGAPFDRLQVQAALNLQLLTGNLGKAGGGLALLAPAANTLGAWELGAVNPENPELFALLTAGKLKGLLLIAEDPASRSHCSPDQAALLKTAAPFLVVQDLFLSEVADQADLVLPALPYSEKGGTFTNVERRVQLLKPSQPPAPGILWTGELLHQLAARLGASWPRLTPGQTLEEIAREVPGWGGLTGSRLEHESLQWPCPRPDHPGIPIGFSEGFSGGPVSLEFT
jgi:predicted molibdopterin-dependent oxidoreductase YjgC